MLRFQLQRHELFECDLKLQGIQYKTLKPRLILTANGKEIYFEGKVENFKCTIPVFLNEGNPTKGIAILELVVDDKEYIQPWNSPYESYTYNLVVTEAKKPAPKPVPEKSKITKEDIHKILDALEKKKKK